MPAQYGIRRERWQAEERESATAQMASWKADFDQRAAALPSARRDGLAAEVLYVRERGVPHA
jgi:hypothetical protein